VAASLLWAPCPLIEICCESSPFRDLPVGLSHGWATWRVRAGGCSGRRVGRGRRGQGQASRGRHWCWWRAVVVGEGQ